MNFFHEIFKIFEDSKFCPLDTKFDAFYQQQIAWAHITHFRRIFPNKICQNKIIGSRRLKRKQYTFFGLAVVLRSVWQAEIMSYIFVTITARKKNLQSLPYYTVSPQGSLIFSILE